MTEADGHIAEIWRFPIKSLQGESVASADLLSAGIHRDRHLALREVATGKILSAKHPKVGERLLSMSAAFETDPTPGGEAPIVTVTIDGARVSTEDPAAVARRCSDALGLEVELAVGGGEALYESYWPENPGLALSDVEIDLPIPDIGSFADLEPLHILTTASMRKLAELAPESVITSRRFRPSMVIDTGDVTGFVENDWEGRTARIGGATIHFGAASPRCVMTTRPQPGLDRDLRVLQALARENRRPFHEFGDFACLGIYATVVEPGPIAIDDPLTLA